MALSVVIVIQKVGQLAIKLIKQQENVRSQNGRTASSTNTGLSSNE